MQSPIIVKKEEKVYSSHVLDVFKNAVIKSDGKESVFSSARIRDGVSVLPIDEKGYAYLIDGYYFGIKKRLTATVSGGIDNGEKPLHAAKGMDFHWQDSKDTVHSFLQRKPFCCKKSEVWKSPQRTR